MRRGVLFLLPFLFAQAVCGAGTVFLGPTHLHIDENGNFAPAEKSSSATPFDNLWAYRALPTDKKLTGLGVKIALADSGITPHPELNGKQIMGQDFTLSGTLSDFKNHGTGVAAIIGARGVRFTGVAPQAAIWAYKIDDGSRLISPQAAANALHTILAYNEANPSDKITVINLSYGISGGGSLPLTNAINRAHDSGVTVVVPAGNFGYPGVFYPANLSTVLAVSALAADGEHLYANSAYGPEVDFTAPGDRVYTASADGDYTLMSGTSAAAAFVSGAAALAVEGLTKKLGRYPSAEEVKDALKAASAKVPGLPDAAQGNGLIDITKLEEQLGNPK